VEDICVALFPAADVPLWQLEQFPDTLVWLKLAGVHALLEWQSLHSPLVWM
jgi:hypothetical protein